MFFRDNRFCPENVTDTRLRKALEIVNRLSATVVSPVDLLHGVILSEDQQFMHLLSGCLNPGTTELNFEVQVDQPSESGPKPKDRSSFSEPAIEILDELSSTTLSESGLADDALLELLALTALNRMSTDECAALSGVNIESLKDELAKKIGLKVVGRAFGSVLGDGLSKLLSTFSDQIDNEEDFPSTRGKQHEPNSSEPRPILLPAEIAPSIDLTYRTMQNAASLETSPFDGDEQFERLFETASRILHKRTCNHIVLVGERGVGKSIFVNEIARRAFFDSHTFLNDRRFIQIDCRHTYPEDSRRRLSAVLDWLARVPIESNSGEANVLQSQLVVAVDGFTGLLRSDRGYSNQATLLSFLAGVQFSLIGLMDSKDYVELVGDDAELLEYFVPVEIFEPDVPTALKLVRNFSNGLEQTFQLQIDEAAMDQAVRLSSNYMLNEKLPSKAVKILRGACEEVHFNRSQLGMQDNRITESHVVRIVSEATGVPESTLKGIAESCDFEKSLKEEIVGQDHAVQEVATELGLIKAGLTDPDKPASVMLFLGQTGTGKTEMAKTLANFYSASKRLRTYTLGNFVEPHSVASIIGVPPGYVGHDQGGKLVHDLRSDPYCVFLLDEADKAHPDVLQPFLNLFDEGWVRDQRGVQGYADKSIFILTSNVGQRMIADMAKQGKSIEEITTRMTESLAQIRHGKSNRPVFAPEFLARIKRTIVFKPLDKYAMEGICRKLVRNMKLLWQDKRQKELIVPDNLVNYIAEEADRRNAKSEGKEGGRIVRKIITDLIEANIQKTIAKDSSRYRESRAVVVGCEIPAAASDDAPLRPSVSVAFSQNVE